MPFISKKRPFVRKLSVNVDFVKNERFFSLYLTQLKKIAYRRKVTIKRKI